MDDRTRRTVRAVLGDAPLAVLASRDEPIAVACSGGADSLALLALACAASQSVVALHVDHCARPGSDREAAIVQAAADRFGAAFRALSVSVAAGPSFEARARSARYDALTEAARDLGAKVIAVGHTRDDQAETVLLNVLRGAAASGLAGMAEHRDLIVRPLLTVPRAATLELCARLALDVVDDPMNYDRSFRRVWVRRELIPWLESAADRDVSAVLARQADVLRGESDLLDSLGASLLHNAGNPPSLEVLVGADPVVVRRALRMWIVQGGDNAALPPSLAEVDAVTDVVAGTRRAANLVGGDTVIARGGRLQRRVHRARPDADEPVAVGLPGTADACGMRFESWVERAAPVQWPDGRFMCVADADAFGDHAVIRRSAPGERYRPLGLVGTTKVRAGSIAVTAPSGETQWVVGYRIADHVRVTPRTRRFLWITAEAASR